MAEGPPTNLNALEARLRNHCEAAGRNLSRARRHVGALVVARLLRGTDTVVKGGRNLEIRYGLAATRASTDVDVVRVRALDELIDHLESVLQQGWAGFTGRVIERGEIRAPVPVDYRPHRLDVKLAFSGRSFSTVQLEAAVEEAGGVQAADTMESSDGAESFAAVGLPDPEPVAVLTLPVQVAQKLHACTAPDTEDRLNDRAHDLVDLQLIELDLDVSDLPEVRAACERLFRSRTGHGWPPTVAAREGWSVRYDEERMDVEADVGRTLDEAVARVNGFIARISAS